MQEYTSPHTYASIHFTLSDYRLNVLEIRMTVLRSHYNY